MSSVAHFITTYGKDLLKLESAIFTFGFDIRVFYIFLLIYCSHFDYFSFVFYAASAVVYARGDIIVYQLIVNVFILFNGI